MVAGGEAEGLSSVQGERPVSRRREPSVSPWLTIILVLMEGRTMANA